MARMNQAMILAWLLVGRGGPAPAAPITNFVTVGGMDWAQPIDFVNLSLEDVNTACPETAAGLCSTDMILNGYEVEGWTWAGVPAVNMLINYYLALDSLEFTPVENSHYVYFLASNFAPAFHADFTPTNPQWWPGYNVVRGWYRGANSSNNWFVQDTYGYPYAEDRQWDSVSGSSYNGGHPSESNGAWFYREADTVQVAEPPPYLLLSLALCAILGFIRWRQTQHSYTTHSCIE